MPRRNDDDLDFPRRRPRNDDDDDRPRSRRGSDRDQDEDDYDDPPRRRKSRRPQKQMNVVGMIAIGIGVLALIIALFMPCFASFSLIPAGIGIIVGFVGLVIAQKSDGRQSPGLPITGMSISAVAMLIAVGWLFLGKKVEKNLEKWGDELEAQAAKEEEKRKKDLAKAATDVKAAQPGSAIRVNAVQFYKTYDDDEDRFDRLYKNKVIEITGTFHEVNFSAGDAYMVMLRGGPDEEDTVDCLFNKDPTTRARLARLQPGATITIRGKCLGDGPILEACVLLE